MAFLLINGYELPPCKRGAEVIVSTVVDAGRNINGEVVGQKIGRDLYKINNLEWPWLTAQQWENILSLLDNFYVSVTLHDPRNGELRTVTMYPGDRSAQPYWVDGNGKPTHYRNCKVNLIDTGR